MIRGRYYANPAYGEATERAREAGGPPAGEDAGEAEGPQGGVHHIYIERHPDRVCVYVHERGPGSPPPAGDEAPSGKWSTQNFERDDHRGVGNFVASVLARGQGTPAGRPGRTPFLGS
jgi:hypothetical protein